MKGAPSTGARMSKEGPGPLMTALANSVGAFPVPVVIVPGELSDADLEALS